MSDSVSIWCQLCYKRQGIPIGQASKLKTLPNDDIDDLKKKVIQDSGNNLKHCHPRDLLVYPPGTILSANENQSIRADVLCSSIIGVTYDNPLIVVAPTPPYPAGNSPVLRTRSTDSDSPDGVPQESEAKRQRAGPREDGEDSGTNMNVNDEQGNWLARVKVGDTKSKALERISGVGPGVLIDKDGFGLLDTDTINEESGPYVFKRQPQQGPSQQQDIKEVVDYVKQQDRENVALRKRVLDLEVQDSRAVSFTDYYKEKTEQGRVQVWSPPSLDALIELPTPLQGDRPRGSEEVVVKPDWKSIVSGNQLVPSFSNGYEVGYVGPKIPDVAFYPSGIERPTAGDFVAFGDAKGDNWTGTSAAEKGQVMLYGHRILDAQPQRTHVYGFITNNARVLLVRATRADESPFAVFWAFSSVLTFEYGMKIFFYLLQNDSGYVSPPSVVGHRIDIRRPLRPGGTCRAFGAVYVGREVVGKLYTEVAKAEEDAVKLRRVRKIVDAAGPDDSRARIPTVVGQEGQWLVLSPLGTRFTSLNFKLHHLEKLLNTLQIVHQANIIHRDVRFANIFLLPDGQVLLNDWGASTEGGSVQLVAGCPPPFCHSDLVDVADALPEPKHDLYSLVVAAARLLLPGMSDNHYARHLDAAFAAAESIDYEGVLRAFAQNIL